MGQIGQWIDQECKASPDVMREVLRRKWGNLGTFFDHDIKECGCLIGTYEVVRGTTAEERHDLTNQSFRALCGFGEPTGKIRIGWRVFNLCFHMRKGRMLTPRREQAEVVRLLKNRIRRSLGISVTELIAEIDPSASSRDTSLSSSFLVQGTVEA